MNQFLALVLLLAVCGSVYMYKQQPTEWNKFVDSLMVSGTSAAPPPSAVAAKPAPPPAPIYVNPTTSGSINPSHVKDVPQPDQTSAAKVYVPPNPLPSNPNWIWTTSDGRTFRNVVIEKAEADRVTIFYEGGTAIVDMTLLPSEIETKLNYDPDLAAQARLVREQSANEAAQDAAAPPVTSSPPR